VEVLAAPRARLRLQEIRKACLRIVFDRVIQLVSALSKLVEGVDSLLAIDDLKVFSLHPGDGFFYVVQVDER
jgi:hypothetical protein